MSNSSSPDAAFTRTSNFASADSFDDDNDNDSSDFVDEDDEGELVMLSSKRAADLASKQSTQKAKKMKIKNSIQWQLICSNSNDVDMKKHCIGYTRWISQNKATNTASKAVTHGCTVHKDCKAIIRVRFLLPEHSNVYEIHKSGFHTEEFSKPPKGVASEVKEKVTEYLKAGLKPTKISSMLSATMPSARQPSPTHITALQKAVKVEERKKFHVDNNRELLLFLETYKLNREDFDSITDLDRMIVLDYFDTDALNDDGESVKCTGFVFSSKRLLMNGFKAYKANNEEGIILNSDGIVIINAE